MRILIAEDQPQLNRSLTKALTAAGWSVDAVPDGAEALLYLDGADYDAVVLSDCTSSVTRAVQQGNLADMQRVGGRIMTAADLEQLLG